MLSRTFTPQPIRKKVFIEKQARSDVVFDERAIDFVAWICWHQGSAEIRKTHGW
jgi:hypothetical protein